MTDGFEPEEPEFDPSCFTCAYFHDTTITAQAISAGRYSTTGRTFCIEYRTYYLLCTIQSIYPTVSTARVRARVRTIEYQHCYP